MKYNILFFFILSSLLLSCNNNSETRNPNVIIVITDDQGYGILATMAQNIITPNLDKFASESLRFNSHVSVCAHRSVY